ncbi:hypothetical protein BDN72DRAFT_921078 [Pluteus cervinus]|uniref:Uncharacterized protein n=1 Tax=Pluteus cervinus TaxID=181527 RepID=A0ACD3AIQ0_9AGAR|nr:hypothetical protein BDN72DRAFT_921078 [Pluteus cervinus]
MVRYRHARQCHFYATPSHLINRILPILYETVIIYSRVKAPPITSLERCGRYVRRLLITPTRITADSKLVASYLHSCPNITNLALWANPINNKTIIEAIKRLPLIRLSIHLDSLFDLVEPITSQAARIFPIFSQLTHLDMQSDVPNELSEFLCYLPSLKYLSVPTGTPDLELDEAFAALPHLKFILFLKQDLYLDDYACDIDDRATLPDQIIVNCRVPIFTEDWIQGATGGIDVWEYVTTLVASIRANQNQASYS